MHSNLSQSSATSKCNYKRWDLVLSGDETDPKYAHAVAHVTECPECQSRIECSATSDMPWWNEAKSSWLECELPKSKNDSTFQSVIIEIETEMPEDSRIEFETVMLSFLEPPSHPELLGRLGRYEIERVIGTGGMGIVLKAHDTELHRVVAIKILGTHLANNASARKRFAREAQAAAAVLHPNVIPIYNVESNDKLPYLVMQCVTGPSLQAKVDNFGPLPIADALRIAKQTAAGLAAAHDQGLVHRDVKPANILLEDNVDRVLLSDFGLARAVDDASLTRTGVVAGTPHYMSPEQARGDSIDTRSDQFSLGAVMYFMLSGRPPFRATGAMGVLHRICTEKHRSIDEVNQSIPVEVVKLMDRLLSKSSQDRFASMHVVEAELERLLALLQSGRVSLRRRSRSIARLIALIAIPSLLAVALVASAIWWNLPHKPEVNRMTAGEAAAQWRSIRSQEQNMQTELDRAELELRSVQSTQRKPPYTNTQDDFYRQIESLQSQINDFERQFPFNPLGDE